MKNYTVAKFIMGVAIAITVASLPKTTMAASVPEGLDIGAVSITGMGADEAKASINTYIQTQEQKKINLKISDDTVETTCKDLGYEWANKDDIESTIDEYTSGNILTRYAKSVELKSTPVSLDDGVTLDDNKLEEFINMQCSKYMASASNATITRVDGKFDITPSEQGIVIDEMATKDAVLSAILKDDESADITVEAVMTTDDPQITTDDLESIKDILGTYTTDFSSSSSARATNLEVGSAKINGHVLMPGETLSGYECMQPFTMANGYKIAHAYENGQVVDSVGGGACQIATTLYNAALRAEIEITQRQNHSMTVGYVPASADAAIAGTYKDIKITNNLDTPIYVEGYTSGRKITFTIWGKETRPEDRTVEFESEILSSSSAGVTQQPDPSLPAGQTVKVSSGHNGRRSRLWKVVKVNGVETERTIVSTDTYNASNSVVRVGTGAVPAPATPAPEAPVETQAETAAPAVVEGVNGGPGVTQ